MQPVELRTERLILRDWTDADREPFAVLNADPEVMAHFPAPARPGRERRDGRPHRHVDAPAGFGLWAVEVVGGPACVGFVGLNPIPFDAAFTPALEVGWRLARSAWGQGYAPEAAVACVDFAFAVGAARRRRLRHGRSLRRAARRDRLDDHPRQHEVAPGDGEDRSHPRSCRRLRPPGDGRPRAPPRPARAVPRRPRVMAAAKSRRRRALTGSYLRTVRRRSQCDGARRRHPRVLRPR